MQEIKANRKSNRAAVKDQQQKSKPRPMREGETRQEYTSAMFSELFNTDPVLNRNIPKRSSKLSRKKRL